MHSSLVQPVAGPSRARTGNMHAQNAATAAGIAPWRERTAALTCGPRIFVPIARACAIASFARRHPGAAPMRPRGASVASTFS